MELTKRNATYKAGDLEANEYDSKTDGKTRPGNVVERSVGFLSSTNGKRLLVCLVVLYIVHWVVVNLIKGTDGSPFLMWFYYQYGKLDNYQKSKAVYDSPSAVLKSAESGFLANEAGFNTDKNSRHNYTAYYDIVMKPYLSDTISIMEVGVRKGGSLKMWRELFNFDSQVWGIDISDFTPQFPKDAHMKVLIGSSTNSEDAERMSATLKNTRFDIIIDDGDHNDWSQKLTFDLLGPLLKETGVYIIEDNFVDDGNFAYYDKCGMDVSVHADISGELLTLLYPPKSKAGRTPLGRLGNKVYPRKSQTLCAAKDSYRAKEKT
jgi:hypothetical protein